MHFGRKLWSLVAFAVFTVGFLPARAQAAIVTLPYNNDFSTSVSDFVETADSQWTLNTTTGKYRNVSTNSGVGTSASVQVAGLGGPPATAEDFVMTTSFVLNNLGGGATTTIGFQALGADANSTDGTGAFYLGDVQMTGNLRLYRINSNVTLLEQDSLLDLVTGVSYQMTMTGTYAANGDLTLSLSLSGNNQSHTITAEPIATAGVLQTNYFGYRNRLNNASSTLDVEYDSFSVTAPVPVPEPSSFVLALVAVAGLAVLGRRTR